MGSRGGRRSENPSSRNNTNHQQRGESSFIYPGYNNTNNAHSIEYGNQHHHGYPAYLQPPSAHSHGFYCGPVYFTPNYYSYSYSPPVLQSPPLQPSNFVVTNNDSKFSATTIAPPPPSVRTKRAFNQAHQSSRRFNARESNVAVKSQIGKEEVHIDEQENNILSVPCLRSLSLKDTRVEPRNFGRRNGNLIANDNGVPLVAVKRPDCGGREGSLIPLLANHFLVKFEPSQPIYLYDVEIIPHPTKEVARSLKRKLVEENSALLSDALPAYDGRKSLYSPARFQEDQMEFEVSLPYKGFPTQFQGNPKGTCKVYKLILKIASTLNGEALQEYLRNKEDHVSLPQNYIQAMDVVLRENPTEKCFPVSRSLYSSSMGEDIGGGAVGLKGFFQSLRATQQGLALNVDFSVTAFHESIGIIPYLQKRCSFLRDIQHNKSRKLTEKERSEVEKTLKNMKVFVCHRPTNQRYRVHSLTSLDTDALTFKYIDGKEIKVIDYFKEHYNHTIEYIKLPCLQVSQSKPCYLPMELCIVSEGQKFLGKLSDEQKNKILNLGCKKPSERKNIIKDVVGAADGPRSGNYVKQFKIYISQEMTQLNGRILQPPRLRLGEGGEIKNLTPYCADRAWNMLKSHVVEGRNVKRWTLICFGDDKHQKKNVETFMKRLPERCQQLGISMTTHPVVSPQYESMRLLEDSDMLEVKLRDIHERATRKLDLLVCVMQKKHGGYADLKRICETSIGVVTQCCLSSNFFKLSSQYLANLALKINAKVGGSTAHLYNPLSVQLPSLFCEPAILFGADVTHPHPMDDRSPSIAAVVASMNWPAATKYVARMRTQTHRKEIIEGLKDMVFELLQEYKEEIKQLPTRILFFRDGVSEGQFYKVLEDELKAIKDACKSFENYNPCITFAVVQKRHHTRLFPQDVQPPKNNKSCTTRPPQKKQNSPWNENILPGTVVDTKITHPREFDFYLCSHSGSKGTSRPTHYHVLWDENKFKSDELQKLINNLCYTFVRCTKPISLVPPAYYAHLAAYRARLYLDKTGYYSSETSSMRSIASSNGHSRLCPPENPPPLPQLTDNVKRLMFYC